MVGGVLLVAGLFFSAALERQGAVLGDVGLMVATHVMGVVGLVLAPIGAVAGLLLLVRRLSVRVALGATMLVVAAAAALAARVPGELRFSSKFYTEAGA